MRKAFTILGFLIGACLCLTVEAYMPFAPVGRKWVWRKHNSLQMNEDGTMGRYYTYTDSVVGDTLINDKPYAIIIRNSTRRLYQKIENGQLFEPQPLDYIAWTFKMADLTYWKSDQIPITEEYDYNIIAYYTHPYDSDTRR